MSSHKQLGKTLITISMDAKAKTQEKDRGDYDRRYSLPVIYTRGTHYEVGYDIGRTFKHLIHQHTDKLRALDSSHIQAYKTARGKEIYEETLRAVKNTYPKYIRELEGTADGAEIPFYILFLLHLDDIILNRAHERRSDHGQGCSTLILNKDDQTYIAHNEDGLVAALNRIYIVNACITEEEPYEEFTAYCYAGLIPGYAQGFNKHLAFAINIIQAEYLPSGKIPRTFVTRALLSATTFDDVERILRYEGGGAADAFAVNLAMLQKVGPPIFYNIEVSPNYPPSEESAYKAIRVESGHSFFHCNKFLHLTQIPEDQGPAFKSSNWRHETKDRLPDPKNLNDALNILGDTSRPEGINIYRDSMDYSVVTVGSAIFDFTKKTYSVYVDNPKVTEPMVVIPLYAD